MTTLEARALHLGGRIHVRDLPGVHAGRDVAVHVCRSLL